MIKTALRKMLSNKWLYLCLLIGLILVVAFISCIPMYTNGVLQRVLTKDLEKIQTTQRVYPGKYWATVNISKANDANNFSTQFYKYEGKLANELYSAFDFDTVASTTIVSCENIYFSSPTLANSSVILTLRSMKGIEEHVNLLYGEMMTENNSADYDFEAMVNQYTYSSKGFKIGEIYTIKSNSTLSREYKVKIVGVFSVPNTADPYWPETSTHTMNDCVYINYNTYTSTLIGNNSNNAVTSVTFYNAIDYSKITLDDVEPIISAYESLEEYVKANSSRVTLRFPLIETVRQYSGKITTLNVLFLLLQIPVFLMLAFYIYMVAGLISNMDRDEIAVLKSRGATNLQIFRKYTVEMGLLCLIAALVGPFLGLFLSSFLGSSNGFLEFVNRSALKISLDSTTYLYVLCAVIVCLVATLIPVFSAARYNIVHMKRSKGAATKMPLWQKMGVDIILLGVSIYGYISRRAATDIASTQMWSDPIIFILSATFILGAGLLFIRIYPLILRFIFRVTRSFLPATLYVSFNHVARGSGKNTFLMLFLVMTLTVGLFSANSARSINTRQERAIEHLNGADVVVSEIWRQKETAVGTIYEEPPLNRFSSINGISDPTRVILNTSFKGFISHEIGNNLITIMAIEPYGFSKVVNTYPSQYKNGINTHIASLYNARNAAIISAAFARDSGLNIGDSVTYTITSGATEFYVADIVESWPGIDTKSSEYFIITSYDHYTATNAINGYYVWLNRDESVSTSDIYTAFAEGDFTLNSISVTSQLIADAKNDPSIQGTNGVLTLGFLISVCISVAGFLIFWILSVRERVLQFGLLGAMGLPMRSLISILAIEQLLISLVSVLAGVVIGYFTSVMYIPFIGSVYMPESAGALFTLVRSGADYTKIYAIVIFMLLLACVALGITVRRINLTQALKLGED